MYRRRAKKNVYVALCLIAMLWVFPITASGVILQSSPEIAPIKTEHSLRLGYCQGETYSEFDQQFYYLVRGMEEYGLMPKIVQDAGFDETVSSRNLWHYLSTQEQKGWKVQFVPGAYISMDSLAESQHGESQSKAIHALMDQQQVELVVTMGTKAGLAVREFASETPFMNFMAADPVGAGIVNDTSTSKTRGAWATIDPESFTRSIAVMYDIFQPKTIGVVYADNDESYIYSGAEKLDQFCAKKQVAVKREFVEDSYEADDYEVYKKNLLAANESLANHVDIFILTTSLLKPEDYEVVLEPFYKAQVPVYSINSAADVKYGALMAVEAVDYQNIGRFGADTIKCYLEGTQLEEANQIYRTAPFLVLNYTIAKRIGYKPDFDMMCSAKKIY